MDFCFVKIQIILKLFENQVLKTKNPQFLESFCFTDY